MKHAFLSAAAAIGFVVLLAAAGSRGAARSSVEGSDAPSAAESAASVTAGARAEPEAEAAVKADHDGRFFLPVLRDGSIESMDLQTYLTGVLLAELPERFSPETRKAQAVACRTYVLRSYQKRRHSPAAVCTDSGCCQGWVDPQSVSPARREAALAAVRATDGLVIRYQGELIEATFFSCSGGKTEAAAEVWGSDAAYLQSVDSPGEEAAAHFRDETEIPLTEFCEKLRAENPAVSFPAAKGAWVGEIALTTGGGVSRIELGGQVFSGRTVRRIFSLRSTAFTLTLTDSSAIFATRGSGHRVGMSQYGAEAMAQEGKSFEEILKWYYRGVDIGQAEP